MKADFSRGFNPDQKRDKEYRRVLLQQGRVLLDSDVAALVDANDRVLRHQSQDLGTPAGGHDRAYMLTAGKLYALFRDLNDVLDPTTGTALVRHVDYTVRFKKRFPSLRLDTTDGSGGSVHIRLFSGHDRATPFVLWLRRDRVDGGSEPPDLTDPDFLRDTATGEGFTLISAAELSEAEFRRFEFTPPDGPAPVVEVVLSLDLLQRVFLGMIESGAAVPEENPFAAPFWIQPGRFHVQGLLVENRAEIAYQTQAIPTPTTAFGFPNPTGDIAVAYLEGWERLVTAIQDPGIRERALSTGLDTSVRTEAQGQVKTFIAPSTLTADAIRQAFANRFVPDGTLVVSAASAPSTESPCDISLEGGFTGRENLLYHFEVHAIAGGEVTFKWSREGGSELFSVHAFQATSGGSPEFNVYVAPELGLRDGDLVEVLNDVVELGDDPAAPASIDGNGRFVPPRRLVGALALLRSVTSDSAGFDKFALRDVENPATNINPPANYYPATTTLRLRRWHGHFHVTPPTASPIPIESGLQVSITGGFEVGDWWQIEARLIAPAPGVGEKPTRHGPERLFAPLALVAPDPASSNRPEIQEWLDEPFVAASQITADAVHFDNTAALAASPPLHAEDTLTLQGALDLILTKGIGAVIVDHITRTFDTSIVLGVWQMTVGDGSEGMSFGDFNGVDAIQQAVNRVRLLAGAGNPWSLRLFVKRGLYSITNTTVIMLGAGEALTLVGEGPRDSLSPTAEPRATSTIRCAISTGSCFSLFGTGARLELENIAVLRVDPFPAATLAAVQQGQILVRHCQLQDVTFALQGSLDTSPQHALIIRDTVVTQSTGVIPIRVTFPAGGTARKVLVENSRFTTQPNTPFARCASALSPVRWDGLTVKESNIELGGSNTVIDTTTPTLNPGLVSVLTSPGNDQMLTIGDLVFEDCQVDAGSSTVSGIFLHLPSGNDPTLPAPGVRVKSIDNVVIRGGRWTIRSNSMRNAAFYVGNQTFAPSSTTDIHIGNLTIEDIEMGWSSPSETLQYATTLAANRAFVFSADRVRVTNLSLFGTVANSTFGELALFGLQRATVDGLRIEPVAQDPPSGGGTQPLDRIVIYSSGEGLLANDISTNGAVTNNFGTIVLSSGGPANAGKRTVLTNCRVRNNYSGAGFFKSNSLDVELIDCSATSCENGVSFTQTASSGSPSFVTIRGGRFDSNQAEGLVILVSSEFAAVTVDGIKAIGNGSTGLRITPTFVTGTWHRRGPVVVNNRVYDNADPNNAQIRIGTSTADLIGGVCMGNFCTGTTNGCIQVDVALTYSMRGLSVHQVLPWAEISRSTTPSPTADESSRFMAFNMAVFLREA